MEKTEPILILADNNISYGDEKGNGEGDGTECVDLLEWFYLTAKPREERE